MWFAVPEGGCLGPVQVEFGQKWPAAHLVTLPGRPGWLAGSGKQNACRNDLPVDGFQVGLRVIINAIVLGLGFKRSGTAPS